MERWGDCIGYSTYIERANCYRKAALFRNAPAPVRVERFLKASYAFYDIYNQPREFVQISMQYIDSALQLSMSLPMDDQQNEILYQKAKLFFQLEDTLNGKAWFKRAIDNYRHSPEKSRVGQRYLDMGMEIMPKSNRLILVE